MSCESEQSGAVEACWAHNPEVRGSKPRSANMFLLIMRIIACVVVVVERIVIMIVIIMVIIRILTVIIIIINTGSYKINVITLKCDSLKKKNMSNIFFVLNLLMVIVAGTA